MTREQFKHLVTEDKLNYYMNKPIFNHPDADPDGKEFNDELKCRTYEERIDYLYEHFNEFPHMQAALINLFLQLNFYN